MTWKSLILGVAALFTACDGASPPAGGDPPSPALWRTGDADTTVYLFGTVHVLPPGLAWRNEAVDAALAASDVVYFETDINPNLRDLAALIDRLGRYRRGERLSDRMSPNDFATVAQVGLSLGLPSDSLEAMKPWFAAMTLSELLIARAGYDPMSGVERTLGPEARRAGKTIRKFETIEEQLRIFADLPEDVQIDYLLAGVREINEEAAMLDGLVAAWARGDVGMLERIMIDEGLASTPEVHDALLTRRNVNWRDALDELIRTEDGVVFVAVGAAHLAGEHSVQTLMADAGYTVERVN